jgi:hypothetical protein
MVVPRKINPLWLFIQYNLNIKDLTVRKNSLLKAVPFAVL